MMVEFRTADELLAHYAAVKARIAQKEADAIAARAPPAPAPLPKVAVTALPKALATISALPAPTVAAARIKPRVVAPPKSERRSAKHSLPIYDAAIPVPRLMWADVVNTVLDYTGLTISELFSNRRRRELVNARHLLWILAYDFCIHLSMPKMGQLSGGMDHTTILNGIKRGRHLPAYESLYDYLMQVALERLNGETAPEGAVELV
jgi:hypothetical protein